ncbi:MAG: response regulator transcription factor [Candidatus Competibacteraceae bacterium]|jgi:DNA-binding NarL/FixJ family response regulator|nr:response regulator transcription factor [Candidatus Competibacteraceae bacterium]
MKLMIVGEQTLLRDSLHHLFDQLEEHPAILEATDLDQALRLLDCNSDLAVAILIVDLTTQGWHPLVAIAHGQPNLPILVLANSEAPEDIQHAIASGARGYVSTSFTWDGLVHALRATLAGAIYVPTKFKVLGDTVESAEHNSNVVQISDYTASTQAPQNPYRLTPRQEDVLQLIRKGKSNKEIARSLSMAEGTVKIHCMAIFRELGVTNRTQAALIAEHHFTEDTNLQRHRA